MKEDPLATVKVTAKWYEGQGCCVHIDYTADNKLDIRHQSLMILEMIHILAESWDKLRRDNVIKLNLDKEPDGWSVQP